MNLARHDADVDALVTDRYLEALLIESERRAFDATSDVTLDPSVRATARRLSNELARVHPSFRFEERLAARLAETAAGMRAGGSPGRNPVSAGPSDHAPTPPPSATSAGGPVSPTAYAAMDMTPGRVAPASPASAAAPAPPPSPAYAAMDMTPGRVAPASTASAALADSATPASAPPGIGARPLLIGGALTSAALAGAAYVAWRRVRAPTAQRLG